MDTFLWVTLVIILVPLLIMALVLLRGRGAFLIAGYNLKSRTEKAKYDEPALCRFMGKLLLVMCFLLVLMFIGIFGEFTWLITLSVLLMILIPLGSAFYANTGRRFLKDDIDADAAEEAGGIFSNSKKATTITIIITVVTLVGIIILLAFGSADPTVNILENELQIRAMYGTTVSFSEITAITLLDANMREIGAGTRRNGFAGFGQALKGNFTAGLLFVQADTEPTIRIERYNRPNIYLNFRDSARTEMLYEELRAVI